MARRVWLGSQARQTRAAAVAIATNTRESKGDEGWWAPEDWWVGGEIRGRCDLFFLSPTSQAPLTLGDQQERVSTRRAPPSRPPALCCVGRRLTFPALPGGSSLESRVTLRGRQRTQSNTVGVFTQTHSKTHTHTHTQHLFSGEVKPCRV